jgi:taurine transport system permease protein
MHSYKEATWSTRLKPYLYSILFIIIIWWLLAALIDRPVIPTPDKALVEFYKQLTKGGLLFHTWVSFYRIALSLILSLLFAIPLGIILGKHNKLDALVAPLIYLTYPIPKVVLLPVFLVLLGYGDFSKIILITLIVFFQILVTTRDAARGIDPGLIMSVKSLGANNRHLYWHVYFLGCLPEILTSLRIALGTSIAVLFIAEAYATQEGLGFFIMDSMGRFNYSRMFAGIIGMALLGFILFIKIDLLEKLCCRWKHLK